MRTPTAQRLIRIHPFLVAFKKRYKLETPEDQQFVYQLLRWYTENPEKLSQRHSSPQNSLPSRKKMEEMMSNAGQSLENVTGKGATAAGVILMWDHSDGDIKERAQSLYGDRWRDLSTTNEMRRMFGRDRIFAQFFSKHGELYEQSYLR